MLRPKKKISKRELKQDALITSYAKFIAWYAERKKQIAPVLVGVVVLILGVVVYLNNRATNNEKASTDLARVFSYFDNGQYQQAIDGIPEKGIPGLKSIVENYGGTRAGDMARFYLASANYSLGRFDEALEQFEDTGDLGPRLVVARLSGIAACYEAKQKYAEAGEYFEKATTAYAEDLNAAENLNNAARSYASAGNKEKAIELYKKLKKNYPTTSFGREADRFISQLSV